MLLKVEEDEENQANGKMARRAKEEKAQSCTKPLQKKRRSLLNVGSHSLDDDDDDASTVTEPARTRAKER